MDSVGDLELTEHGKENAIPEFGENLTSDEREMAFYGKKAQLKVRGQISPS